MIGKQDSNLITCQHSVVTVLQHTNCQPVGIGVVGKDQIAVQLFGGFKTQIHGALFLRVRKTNCWKQAIWFSLSCYRRTTKTCSSHQLIHHKPADPVQGGVSDGNVPTPCKF